MTQLDPIVAIGLGDYLNPQYMPIGVTPLEIIRKLPLPFVAEALTDGDWEPPLEALLEEGPYAARRLFDEAEDDKDEDLDEDILEEGGEDDDPNWEDADDDDEEEFDDADEEEIEDIDEDDEDDEVDGDDVGEDLDGDFV